ncbi:helicase [Aureococcus anophagefferens]|nr:helicase [Aureococcus anophagefferens]
MMLLRRAAGWTRVLGGAARPARPTLSRTFGDVARRSLVQGAEETVSGLDYAAEEGFEPPKVRLVGEPSPAEDAAEEQADEAPAADPDPRLIAGREGVHAKQAAKLAQRGIDTMTEIQHLTFDAAHAGRDVLGKSRTGTGKTLAFGLPLVERLAERAREGDYDPKKRARGPAILVLAPTRELAKQVEAELHLLAQTHGLSTTCFHGGVSYGPQENALRRGVDVLVATVGRVIDHIDRGNLDLSDAYHVVLDEADEMLSMGFADDVERIFSECPAGKARGGSRAARSARDRSENGFDLDGLLGAAPPPADAAAPLRRPQTLLFSATAPSWVKKLTSKYLEDPELVDVVGDARQQAATTVTHKAVLVPRGPDARASLLEDIIAVEISKNSGQATDEAAQGGGRVIVFTSTKKECDELAGGPAFQRLAAQVLHGDIGQAQRETTLAQFRRGAFTVLVATDVAARGIDVKGVDLVVQYRTPRDAEGYVHRSGRTGRAGRDGTAVVLYDEREERDVRSLERLTGVKFARQGPPSSAQVLGGAAADASMALAKVEDTTKRLVAKCLAAISRKTDVSPRSLVTGESGKLTLLMKAPRPLKTSDVVYAVSKLLERVPQSDEGVSGEQQALRRDGDRVGAVRVCKDATTAVFDLPQDKAAALLRFVEEQNFDKFAFAESPPRPASPLIERRRPAGRNIIGGAPAAAAAAPTGAAAKPENKKYAMMQKMHLPRGAIEQKMRAEGRSEADIAEFFGA